MRFMTIAIVIDSNYQRNISISVIITIDFPLQSHVRSASSRLYQVVKRKGTFSGHFIEKKKKRVALLLTSKLQLSIKVQI